jgi:putative pyruvate formate lyase activating enzyme
VRDIRVPSFVPGYRSLGRQILHERVERGLASLSRCRVCPRDCDVDRLRDGWAVCKTGRYAVVSSAFPHFGEEDCLRGWKGSGTLFFSHCNLRCVFCQNYDISQAVKGRDRAGSPPEDLAALMLALQARGCHNINFVTPEHVVPQVLEALELAVERGLDLPLVYNTSAYDSMESLELLGGVVDLYMPDFKVFTEAAGKRWLLAADYGEVARAAIREMHRQVGPLVIEDDGLARRGVLVRHLVMPGALEETRAVLEWIADELGPETYVNLMDQYRPAGRVTPERFPEIARRPTSAELREAREIARKVGLRRLDERRPPPLRGR